MKITIKDAVKEYYGRKVLEIEELVFEEGQTYALMGLNGSGKSTLLQCMSGLETLSRGEILYGGFTNIEGSRKDISIMMQKPYMFNYSVLENIKLGLRFRSLNSDEMEKRWRKYASCFDIKELLDKNAKKLSGGEQAKTSLLRTVVMETEVTFLDEPTASMDIESTLRAEELIKRMAGGRRTVVLVTHDLYQAERVADQVIFLDKGKVIEKGDKQRVFNAPEHNLVRQILRRGEEYDKNSNTDNQR